MATDEAGPSSRTVWIRGPGLNSVTQPNRAEEFLGENWENISVEVAVLKMRPGGHMYVQLKDGYKLWVGPQFVTGSVTEGEDAQEREEEGPELEDDLGTDVEDEDVEPNAEGDIEGSGPLSYRGAGGLPWVDTWVLQDQRTSAATTRCKHPPLSPGTTLLEPALSPPFPAPRRQRGTPGWPRRRPSAAARGCTARCGGTAAAPQGRPWGP